MIDRNSELDSGGLGGPGPIVNVEVGHIRDTRMVERALRKRWPIKEEHKEAVVTRLMMIVADRKSSNREATSAAKALLAAESQNQGDDHQAEGQIVKHVGTIDLNERRTQLLGILHTISERGGAGPPARIADGLGSDGSEEHRPDEPPA